MRAGRRNFLGTVGLGLLDAGSINGIVEAGQAPQGQGGGAGRGSLPVRKVKTTTLFKSPEGLI
jgi:hypothetical protein